jgi:hypothetical protein
MGPIASKLVDSIRRLRDRKIARIAEARAAQQEAARLLSTAASRGTLEELDPAHGAYAAAQNLTSVLSELVTQLPAMRPLVKLIGPAEDDYMPGGPPMSPITTSFFTCWAFFDACVGAQRETIATCLLAIRDEVGMVPELVGLIEKMERSRMGLYLFEGRRDGLAILRDLVGGETVAAVAASGYAGRKGELWYARVLPPPAPHLDRHVVFTTPYISVEPGLDEWRTYLERIREPLDEHFKYGPDPRYWTEFVFEAYAGHDKRGGAIFLAGLPDRPETRPHSRIG